MAGPLPGCAYTGCAGVAKTNAVERRVPVTCSNPACEHNFVHLECCEHVENIATHTSSSNRGGSNRWRGNPFIHYEARKNAWHQWWYTATRPHATCVCNKGAWRARTDATKPRGDDVCSYIYEPPVAIVDQSKEDRQIEAGVKALAARKQRLHAERKKKAVLEERRLVAAQAIASVDAPSQATNRRKARPPLAPPPNVEPLVKPLVEQVVEQVVEPVVKPVVKPVVEPLVEPLVEPVASKTLTRSVHFNLTSEHPEPHLCGAKTCPACGTKSKLLEQFVQWELTTCYKLRRQAVREPDRAAWRRAPTAPFIEVA